ncbi:MAG: VOC family protein [Candidatus Binatia bacterium]
MPKPTTIQFDHVACGVRSLAAVAPLLEQGLGARAHRGGPGQGFRGGQWAFAGEGRLELIEPDGPDGGFLHRFLAAQGPAIHHVTFKVPDLRAARDRAAALGYDVIGFNEESPAWKECFLHPKQAGGIVVQMAETDPDAGGGNWLPFASYTSGTPPARATLKGLGLVSRSAAASERCWVELLGAAAHDSTPGERLFTWKDSPLRLRVIVDPGSPHDGPVGLDFAPYGRGFPDGLEELLGAKLLESET